MSKFLSPLNINYVDGTEWEVGEDFKYRVGSPQSNWILVVPKGTRTDFASIPKPLRLFMPMRWKYSTASVLHDFLYRHGDKSRVVADAIFYEAMLAEGLHPLGAKLCYLGVLLFGGAHYKGGVDYPIGP